MPPVRQNVVLFDAETERAVRAVTALGAKTARLSQARPACRGAPFVLAFAPPEDWPWLVLDLVSWHARALVVSPLGPPAPLPRGSRAIARFLLPSQAAARAWAAFVPLGRLVVVEPAPEARHPTDGIFVATEADLLDPEALISAARAGAAIVSGRSAEGLPPSVLVAENLDIAREALRADPARRAALGRFAQTWAEERRPADEAAAFAALAREVTSMARRGGRAL